MSQIRQYEQNDENRIIDVWYQSSAVAHPFLSTDFISKVKKDMSEIYLPNAKTWVYEEKGTIVGFISMIENEIGGLFVIPNYHSKGIGSQLVDFVSNYHKVLEVEVFEKNKIGHSFYNKYGFNFMKEYIHEETNFKILRLEYTINKIF